MIAPGPTVADNFNQIERLIAADGAASDFLGKALDLSGNTLVVGAPEHYHPAAGIDTGGAYIFSADSAGEWSEQTELRPTPELSAEDLYGHSVAVSGDTAVVSAFNTTENAVLEAGAAYVFKRNTSGSWIQQDKLMPDVISGQRFGISVAILGDIAMIGASKHTATVVGQGAVYVFERSMGGNWTQTHKLVAGDPSTNVQFGGNVQISGDLAVVSAKDDPQLAPQAGAVYIFARQIDGSWQQESKLLAQDSPDPARNRDQFGEAVAIEGNVVVVGAHVHNDPVAGIVAGAAYVFTRSGPGTWLRQKLGLPMSVVGGNQFGQSVDVSGTTILVSTHAENNGVIGGSAYRYAPDLGGIWTVQQKILPDLSSVFIRADLFGSSVSVADHQAAVGTSFDINEKGHRAGAVYVFRTDNTPAGMAVVVEPTSVDDDGVVVEGTSLSMIFDDVTAPGTTTVVVTENGPPPQTGFQLGTPTTYYDIFTDASFNGSVQVCIDYTDQSYNGSQQEPNLTLDHFKNGAWSDITTSLDTDNNIICGSTTSFSFFAILEPSDPIILIAILISRVVELNLHQGISNSLDKKLQAAKNALEDVAKNNDVAAINVMGAFIDAVEAQSGKSISVADADSLVEQARLIIDLLAI